MSLLSVDNISSVSNSSSSLLSHQEQKAINLIVNYLPQTMTCDELRTLFESIGPVESCKLIINKRTNQSLCYGFVNFVSSEDACTAIHSLNGLKLESKVIKVSPARPSSESIKGANLYVGNLPRHWSVEDLISYFSQCGRIIACRILNVGDSKCQASKGVGFVRYDQKYEAENAIERLHGKSPYGSSGTDTLVVKFASKTFDDSKITLPSFSTSFLPPLSVLLGHGELLNGCGDSNCLSVQPSPPVSSFLAGAWCLFVYNLDPEVEENALWQLFGPFGAVQSVKVVKSQANQKCKGFGFVTMSVYEEAANAVAALNGFMLANRILQVSFKTS